MSSSSPTIDATGNSALVAFNIAAQAPLKLTSTNYTAWAFQFRTLLTGYDLFGFLDGSKPCPAVTVTVDGTTSANPAYTIWVRQDQLILSAIIGALTPSLIPFIATVTTSSEAWKTLANTYGKASRGRILTLKNRLHNPLKGTRSITEFMLEIKGVIDELALLGVSTDPEDLALKVLNGLDDSYKELSNAIQARETPILFDELHEKLLSTEAQLTSRPTIASTPPATAFYTNTNNGRGYSQPVKPKQQRPPFFSQGQSRQQPSPNFSSAAPSTGPRPYLGKCQLCGEQGHSARRCSSFRYAPVSQQQSHNRPAYVSPSAHTAASSPTTSEWILDSGASHHITTDLANLSLHTPYDGLDSVVIGDGKGLTIANIGTLEFPHIDSLQFPNTLHVPQISRNLISVSRLCATNDVVILFSDCDFQVKDRRSGDLRLRGPRVNGLYLWPTAACVSPYALSSVKQPLSTWHARLGHPSSKILDSVVSSYHLPLHKPLNFSCNSCKCIKSHKLPFNDSSLTSSMALELIFSDVWTSPILSEDGYKYYVIFVDHFTKYVWLYPLKRKSDVLSTFVAYKALVENFFKTNIITLYTDNGGEFLALRPFLTSTGITHLTTPPHTPEHNGCSERRHRHIVDTGLTLLHQASMPLTYWPYAMSTATYIINRLPKIDLSMKSSYEALFNHAPNISKLRVFGCQCYPWLRPYSTHKLDNRSRPCVFVGYSLTQSAYMCLDISSQRLYISRHVEFVENKFPFFSHNSTSEIPQTPAPPLVSPVPTPPPVPIPLPAPTAAPQSPDRESSPEMLRTCHTMVTRSKNQIFRPNPRYCLTSTLTSDVEPTTVSQALSDPRWREAMSSEFSALQNNGTWDLIPPDASLNVLGCKWVFRIKRKPDGSVDKFKARLVAKGFHQRAGIDYFETYSPVVKPATVRIVLSLAISQDWSLRQFDVNNAFLHGTLTDDVYMAQPPGFSDKNFPSYVCKLHKSIYGLKQAPRTWYNALRCFLSTVGFVRTKSDESLFVYNRNGIIAYFLVYVDDLILTGNTNEFLHQVVAALASKFSVKDLGSLSYFLGVEVLRNSTSCTLLQRKYITDLLGKHNMLDAKPVQTPLAPGINLSLHDGSKPTDAVSYRRVLGSLQYLLFTRPDIAFAVNKLSQFMHAPTECHWGAVKRLLRYLNGTRTLGITLRRQSPISLHCFTDADWAGNCDDRTSTGAYILYLGANPISWSSRKQRSVARSSTEAEYRAIATAAVDVQWTRSLLSELHVTLSSSPVVYSDNIGATYLCSNPVFHSRMKHIAIDYHFVRDLVQSSELRVSHVSSADQLADALTKPLSRARLQLLMSKIGLTNGAPT